MRNRWLIALAAIGLHISIGSVYAWSVLTDLSWQIWALLCHKQHGPSP